MKKLVSLILVCLLLLSCLPVLASAEGDLPFELVAPGNVSAVWMEGNDSPTTTSIAYSLSNDMTDFFKRLEEANLNDTVADFMAPYGVDELIITTQVDWAVDDVDDPISGWHYNEFWDAIPNHGLGYDDEGRCRVGDWDGVDMWIGNATETVNTHWVTRGVREDALNGNPETQTPGLKDQMNPDQYEYRYEDGDGSLWIDYTKHTVYFRMRFVVTTNRDTGEEIVSKTYYSDWSNTAAVGKDGVTFEPLTADDLPTPVVTDLHMTDKDFNDQPVVAFTLTVPDDLATMNTAVNAAGGEIRIETFARVRGDEEWTLMGNTDWLISAGERECALITLATEDRPIIPIDQGLEFRFRYFCLQRGLDDVYSAYSEIVTLGTEAKLGDVNHDGNVDMKDVLLMRKFIAGYKINLDETLADVNEDGSVNMKDVLMTRKFVARLIDKLGKQA